METLGNCCLGWLVMAVVVYAVLIPALRNAPYMDE